MYLVSINRQCQYHPYQILYSHCQSSCLSVNIQCFIKTYITSRILIHYYNYVIIILKFAPLYIFAVPEIHPRVKQNVHLFALLWKDDFKGILNLLCSVSDNFSLCSRVKHTCKYTLK